VILVEFMRGGVEEAVSYIRALTSLSVISAVVSERYAGVREGRQRRQLGGIASGLRIIKVTREMAIQGGPYLRQYVLVPYQKP
jgi:hypothetical protein